MARRTAALPAGAPSARGWRTQKFWKSAAADGSRGWPSAQNAGVKAVRYHAP
jgi:hypothetical protein